MIMGRGSRLCLSRKKLTW